MRTFTIDLWEGYKYPGAGDDGFRPGLDAYLLKSEAPRPAALILPGGAYAYCSPREAEAVAVQFNAAGYHAFVLRYSCAPRRHPAPLLDCARAFTLIREHAGEWLLDPAKLGLMGFSAGGHLALSGAVFYDRDFAAAPGINPALSRPDALMLCYPVVVSGEFAHRGSFEFLLGKNPDPRLLELLSLEKQVREDMPPVFLWHTYADEGVPVENSLFLASALRRAGVSLEMHIFHEGHHGLSLATVETEAGNPANVNPHVAHWFPLCLSWLESRFKG